MVGGPGTTVGAQPVETLTSRCQVRSGPNQLATFSIEGFEEDTVHDPKVRGNTTFFSWYSLGVVAVDSSRPARPTLLAQFVPDTDYINPDFFCAEPCAQVWGVFVLGRLVVASDMNSGLYLLRLT
jgi:hypothetical protein